jgi:hypothetical protein
MKIKYHIGKAVKTNDGMPALEVIIDNPSLERKNLFEASQVTYYLILTDQFHFIISSKLSNYTDNDIITEEMDINICKLVNIFSCGTKAGTGSLNSKNNSSELVDVSDKSPVHLLISVINCIIGDALYTLHQAISYQYTDQNNDWLSLDLEIPYGNQTPYSDEFIMECIRVCQL